MRALLYLIAIFGISTLSFAQSREEIDSLEELYESRARTAIKSLLNPYDYSLTVAVEIDRDEGRLQDIKEEFEKQNLPGMPGSDQLLNSFPLVNKVYGLRTRLDVHLTVDESVDPTVEATIKQVLKMKLQLDESNGDSLTVLRASLPREGAPKADALPELSWRMWLLVLIVALAMLGGLIVFLNSRRQQRSADSDKPSEEAPAQPVPEAPAKAAVPAIEAPTPTRRSAFERSFELKEQILSMTTQYPKAMTDAVQRAFLSGLEKEVMLLAESFGWETSKKIFATLPGRTWAKIGNLIKERTEEPSSDEVAEAVEICFRHLLARFLELSDEDQRSPFAFLNRIERDERDEILGNESLATLAIISTVSDSGLASEIFQSLDSQKQELLVVEMTKLTQVPSEAIEASARQLQIKLQNLRQNPKFRADGPTSVISLMAGANPTQELAIIRRLMVAAPEKLNLIRRQKLIYPDIAKLPPEILSEVSQNIDTETLVKAFFKGFPEVRDAFLPNLPPKKARMVQGDLERPGLKCSEADSDIAKRTLVEQIELWLQAKGIKLEDVSQEVSKLEAA